MRMIRRFFRMLQPADDRIENRFIIFKGHGNSSRRVDAGGQDIGVGGRDNRFFQPIAVS